MKLMPELPIAHLDFIKPGDFTFVSPDLAQLPEGQKFIEAHRRAGGQVILNNDPDKDLPIDEFLELARYLHVDEIVCPDKTRDRRLTLERTVAFLEKLVSLSVKEPDSYPLRIMLVPQGRDASEWSLCLDTLLRLHDTYARQFPNLLVQRPVIGIARIYDSLLPDGLIGLLNRFGHLAASGKVDVHLLGSPHDLFALSELVLLFPRIRSMNTAQPIVYALHQIRLQRSVEIPAYPGRPENYLHCELRGVQKKFGWHNIEVFRVAARGAFFPAWREEI